MKKPRDKLVKITEEVIAGGRAVQAELDLLQGESSLVIGLTGRLGERIQVVKKVVRQTQEVIKGNRSLPRWLVTLFDVDAPR